MEVVYHRCKMDRQVDLFFSAENYCSYKSWFFYCIGNIIFYTKFSKHSARFETLNTILQHLLFHFKYHAFFYSYVIQSFKLSINNSS